MPTSHPSLLTPRVIAVLDTETVLDEAAASIAGRKSSGLPIALQKIATACILAASEHPDGTWSGFRLDTFAEPMTEHDVLLALDDRLVHLATAGGALATFNGRHDLAVLRRRGTRHWMFGLPGLTAANDMDHIDLMLRHRTGLRDAIPSLRDACAGLGICAFDPRGGSRSGLAPDVIKCQTDVVATFLLALYEIATERGTPDALEAGWQGLSDHLGSVRPRALHLEHFREHRLLRAARNAREGARAGS